MQSAFGHHFHAPMQEILNIRQQSTERQARLVRRQRHQQVDITGIVGIASCHGAEYSDIANAVTLGKREDLDTMALD